MKPEIKGLENEVSGPPPSEPMYVLKMRNDLKTDLYTHSNNKRNALMYS
jgi:hypothetical protein